MGATVRTIQIQATPLLKNDYGCHCWSLEHRSKSFGNKRILELLMETKDTCNAIGAKSIWAPLLGTKDTGNNVVEKCIWVQLLELCR